MISEKSGYEIDDIYTLHGLALQSAATILHICETRDPASHHDPLDNGGGYDEIAVILRSYGIVAESLVNALQSMVSLVHDFAEHCLHNNRFGWIVEDRELKLFADALQAYQSWKTVYIQVDNKRNNYPRGWGSATKFVTADWSDICHSLMEQAGV